MTPHAAPSRCTMPQCGAMATHKGRCEDHQSSGWVDRPRPNDKRTTQERLGISTREWLRLKAFVMARDEGRCHVCGKQGADEVDHIIAIALGGSKTDPNNLAPIHSEPCHKRKTQNELARLRSQSTRRRTGTKR